MDNNEKDLNAQAEVINEVKTVEPKKEKPAKPKKKKALRSQFLFKKGGYSIAIIALMIAALILLNWLVSSLGERFHLEYDMSSEKVNSMTEENIKFIEGVKEDVTVTVCAAEDSYASYMNAYAQNYYGISEDGTEYFDQTVTLVNKYKSYNDKISVSFVDPQSSEFVQISQKYSNAGVTYGSIIVNCTRGENERYKILGFSDIYELSTDDTYAAYGYTTSTIDGNNVETALTGAIAYCVSSKTPKIAVYTGHSANDYSASLNKLLKDNNFEVNILTEKIIGSISEDYDAVAILSPTVDFIDSELDILAAFLDNGGKLSKGFLYFADATCPSLPNLESFLSQWGINVQSGVLFETYSDNCIQDDPSTMGIYPAEAETAETDEKNTENALDESVLNEISICITGKNVPISIGEPADNLIKVNAVMNTLDSAVIAPAGAASDWSDYTDDDKKQYQSVIEAKKIDYNSDNKLITSYVYAFSSVEYIDSDWAENTRVSNKDLVLACSERAANVEDSGIKFTSKTITNETFADSVTQTGINVINVIFVWALPIIVLALGVFIYIKRRNA
ncbi:MAG: GldG family protein [Clostridia bacterium]|nr:GldG family protein [Clostridia bacterium]